MNKIHNIFIFRKSNYKKQWHLRCINCGTFRSIIWETELDDQDEKSQKKVIFSSSGTSINVYLPPGITEVPYIPPNPQIIYGKGSTRQTLDSENSVHVIASQNECVLITEDDLSNITLPQFLSTEFCSTLAYEMRISFEIPFLEDLPESAAVDKLQRKISAGDRFLEMMLSTQHTRVRIPPGLPMPASIESYGRFVAVVYVIKEWVAENEASVICYASSHLEESRSLSLIREFRESSYRSFVGPTHPEYVVPGSAKDHLHRVLIGQISQCNLLASIPPVDSVSSAG